MHQVKHFKAFEGQHCETTATGSLLKHLGINISEAMLFGIGEGLGYIYWKMKNMDFPFIGGRIKTDILTQNICKNLNLKLEIKETGSMKKAWENVVNTIDQDQVVGLKLDCYHLDYFTNKIHFAGHYVAMYGYDESQAYLVDTVQQGGMVSTSLSNLALARNERGPMSSKNLSYTITKNAALPAMKHVITAAIYRNAIDYLNPPIKNFGFKGIAKTASEIYKWFDTSKNVKYEFETSAMLMERAGTGGALFRNLYRDFLKVSIEKHTLNMLQPAYERFIEHAKDWSQLAELFATIGKTGNRQYMDEAAQLLRSLSEAEKQSMELLQQVCRPD